jgi:hypothetical protein
MHPDLFLDVPEERLELSRDNSQRLLRPQRLPISPSGHISGTQPGHLFGDANIMLSVNLPFI